MQTYRLTRAQLETALKGAIGLYLEFRNVHGHEDGTAQDFGVNEVLEGLDADHELAANGPAERLRLQLPDAHEDLLKACDGFRWLGNNLDNIKHDPDQFRSYFEAALQDTERAIAKARGAS